MQKTKNLFIGIIAIYALRLIISASMGIMPQDAYYYFYSKHLALSYFDHPPMVAYIIKVFTSILGSSVLVLKLTNFIVSLGTFFALYHLSKLFIGNNKSNNSIILYGSSILLTVLSINTTPDVALILFWTLSLITLYKAVFEERFWYWPIAGLVMGLTFDSKYTALFLPACLILFLLLSNQYRKHLFSFRFLLMIVIFAATVSPIFIWNIQHDWLSFKFQSAERADSIMKFKIQPNLFLGNVGTQFILLLPVLFIGMMAIMYKHIVKLFKSKKLPNAKILFLICFSLPIMLFFYPISTIYWVKLNWLMPAYISGTILTAIYIKRKYFKTQLIVSFIFHILLLIEVAFYIVPIKSDDTWYGWEETAEQVNKLHNEYPDRFMFSADDYKTTAVLNYYLDTKVYAKNILGGNALHYLIIDNDLSPLKGKDAIFIDSDKKIKNLEKKGSISESLYDYFESVEELDPILVKDNSGTTQRKFYIFKCNNYKGAQKLINH